MLTRLGNENLRPLKTTREIATVAFVVENLRLKELAIVAEQNRPAFEYLVEFLIAEGYQSLQAFVLDEDSEKAEATILRFLQTPLPDGLELFDGIARPYAHQKAKWLLLGWVFRDAPEQRLRPQCPVATRQRNKPTS